MNHKRTDDEHSDVAGTYYGTERTPVEPTIPMPWWKVLLITVAVLSAFALISWIVGGQFEEAKTASAWERLGMGAAITGASTFCIISFFAICADLNRGRR
tara:strand:- start:810 stop:1109 length:300 start_codon:yes stop_codon:yes gene_type:complete